MRKRWNTAIEMIRSWLDRPLRSGTLVADRYELRRVLGIGSYGISYLAEDRRHGVLCVLKQVKPSRRKGRKGKPIFEREASILERLNHPGFPRLLNRLETNGHLFLVMDYICGTNVEDLIFTEGRSFTEKEALRFASELFELVEAIHARGIVHRDLRIPNVITDGKRLYVIDFGLACPVGDPGGPPDDADGYPEEKRIRRMPEYSSDYYALGHFILFLLYSAYKGEPDAPERGWEEELDLAPGTRRLLRRLLQIDAPYRSADELKCDLTEAICSLP